MNNKTHKTTLFDIINTLLLLLIGFSTLYPFIYLIIISFSPIEQLGALATFFFPKAITLDSYKYVLRFPSLGDAYLVSFYITVIGTLVNLICTSLGAYVLANKGLPGKKFFTTFIVVTMIFNGGLIPFYLVVKMCGMLNSLWALMIPSAVNTFYLIIMRNFFATIPESLAESARIDGSSEYRIFFTIILPLSGPIIATMALFYGVAHWNEYFHAIIFLNKPDTMPLQVLIRSMYQSATDTVSQDTLPPPVETIRAATILVATMPILCVYPFLQKYFVKGIMVGAVKG